MNPADLPIRDIHLPAPIGWWPPAIGWWVLAAVLLMLGLFLLWRLWRRKRGQRALDQALLELEQLRRRHARDSSALLRELSVLLRRAAISQYGRNKVAGLTGAEWVGFLDQKAGQVLFKGRLERFVTEIPYRPDGKVETEKLVQAIRQWLRAQRGGGHV